MLTPEREKEIRENILYDDNISMSNKSIIEELFTEINRLRVTNFESEYEQIHENLKIAIETLQWQLRLCKCVSKSTVLTIASNTLSEIKGI